MENIKKCDKCGYETITFIDYEYEHENCGGLMKKIALSDDD